MPLLHASDDQSPNSFLREIRNFLSPRNRPDFDQLIERPEVQKVLVKTEQERLSARTSKIKRLQAIEGQFRAPIETAAKRLSAAKEQESRLRIEMDAVQAETHAAHTAWFSICNQQANMQSDLEAEIRREADPRIKAATDLLYAMRANTLRHAVQMTLRQDPNTRRQVMFSNAAAVNVAIQEVNTAIEECADLTMQVIATEELESRLVAIFGRIAQALQPLGIVTAPTLQDGAVVLGKSGLPVQEVQLQAAA